MPNVAFGHISETDRWTDRQADRTSHSLLCGCLLIIGDAEYKFMLILLLLRKRRARQLQYKMSISLVDKMKMSTSVQVMRWPDAEKQQTLWIEASFCIMVPLDCALSVIFWYQDTFMSIIAYLIIQLFLQKGSVNSHATSLLHFQQHWGSVDRQSL